MKVLIIGSAGYIGSNLYTYLKQKNIDVVGCDVGIAGIPDNTTDIIGNYDSIDVDQYDTIVVLAGYNSPFACRDLNIDIIENNVSNFIRFVNRTMNKKIIYASSVCVYGNKNGIVDETTQYGDSVIDYYGLSKIIIDKHMELSTHPNYYGLRFGTMVGGSYNMRWNLMLNKMMHDAYYENAIQITNGTSKKPILYIKDAVETIYKIIISDIKNPGFFNMISHNDTVETYAKICAEYFRNKNKNVEVVNCGNVGNCYSYDINNDKIERVFGITKTPYTDILDDIFSTIINKEAGMVHFNRLLEKNYKYSEILHV